MRPIPKRKCELILPDKCPQFRETAEMVWVVEEIVDKLLRIFCHIVDTRNGRIVPFAYVQEDASNGT